MKRVIVVAVLVVLLVVSAATMLQRDRDDRPAVYANAPSTEVAPAAESMYDPRQAPSPAEAQAYDPRAFRAQAEDFPPPTDRIETVIAAQREARLVEQGFTEARAAWILARMDQLRLVLLEEQFAQVRTGTTELPDSVAAIASTASVHRRMREEMDDDAYERYRRAMWLDTVAEVREVPAGSIAERAGIRPGDQILTYEARRIFELAEIEELAAQGTPGEPVVIEVVRDGLRTQLFAERGPLGIPEYRATFSAGLER